MIYDHANVHIPAHAYDVDSRTELQEVYSIDTDSGEVACGHLPVRLKPGTDDLDTYTLRFRSIYPLGADEFGRPCLFHCYGLVQ